MGKDRWATDHGPRSFSREDYTDREWNSREQVIMTQGKPIVALSTTTKETIDFRSIGEAALFFQVTKGTIKYRLKVGTVFRGYILKHQDN